MIGIHFTIPNNYGRCLGDILEGINLGNTFWRINNDDAFLKTDITHPLFLKNYYMEREFFQIIKGELYYVISIKLQCFIKPYENKEVKTYEEFLKSSCELILVINDNEEVTIYTKNQNWFNSIKDNIFKKEFKINWIKDELSPEIINDFLQSNLQGYIL